MNEEMFASANMQMAQAFREGLETWWKALLGDSDRLKDLASQLSGVMTNAPSGGDKNDDMVRVLTALELFEGRLERMEGQVQDLAQNLSMLVGHLESLGTAQKDGKGQS